MNQPQVHLVLKVLVLKDIKESFINIYFIQVHNYIFDSVVRSLDSLP
jgi:hypothetical protein